MAMRIEKMVASMLKEAHERQVEEVVDVRFEGPENLCKRPIDLEHAYLPPVSPVDDHLNASTGGRNRLRRNASAFLQGLAPRARARVSQGSV